VRGPFAYWQHIHSVRAVDQFGPGVTVVTDEIDYEVPLGSLGRLAHQFFLRRQIESAFAFRRQAVTAALASVQPAPVKQETRAAS
jgi:ligand-binding SRPBCC domain-containing protein